MSKLPVTVIVSVKNEEINLPHCLERLGPFDEVLVVDSMSTDATPHIIADFGYTKIDFKWNGQFPKKRNWTLEHVPIKNDWVLFLDADEFVTDTFVAELRNKITHTGHTGFWIYYNNYFMGSEQKYGLKMRKLALFKKDSGRFERIEEDSWSHLDMEIHEHPVINGSIGHFKSTIVHKDYKGLEHYIARHNAYSTWEAKRYLQLKAQKDVRFTFRQTLKYKLVTTGLLPFSLF